MDKDEGSWSRDAHRHPSVATTARSVSAKVKLRLALLAVGLIGLALIGWMLLNTSGGVEAARRLGVVVAQRYFEGALGIVGLPLLAFCFVLSLWCLIDLIRFYREANDPNRFRRRGRRRHRGRGSRRGHAHGSE